MKIATVLGARPQFIKAAPVSRTLRQLGHEEVLIHTGQHYDHNMSQVFFDELEIPAPDVELGVGSGPQGWQTGQMLIQIERALAETEPDCVLVYGDTNSTLAGALAAVKREVPLIHIEAGLRSFNRSMPEEHNRVVTDHVSDLLFCPTETAVRNLAQEGISRHVHLVGDTMYDAVLWYTEKAERFSSILRTLELNSKDYLLATLHRAYNTDAPDALRALLRTLASLGEQIVFPMHPRTRAAFSTVGADLEMEGSCLKVVEPVGYLDMLVLEKNARLILTDSGGVQKEAFFAGVPCVTLRPETEWVETVETGWNVVVGTDPDAIRFAVQEKEWPGEVPPEIFGAGDASARIVDVLESWPESV